MKNATESELKTEVETLARIAFHQRLISGYGDGEYPHEYQIVYKGKPRHFALNHAKTFLQTLLSTPANFAS
ncbi:MAG: hypothetical protein Kow00121_10930 [Elainellaceae cyanobacterium]